MIERRRTILPLPKGEGRGEGEPRVANLTVQFVSEIASLVGRAGSLESSAASARLAGDESTADGYFHEAFGFALDAAKRAAEVSSPAERLEVLRLAARMALECGEAVEARRLMDEALTMDASVKFSDEWEQLHDTAAWPDT